MSFYFPPEYLQSKKAFTIWLEENKDVDMLTHFDKTTLKLIKDYYEEPLMLIEILKIFKLLNVKSKHLYSFLTAFQRYLPDTYELIIQEDFTKFNLDTLIFLCRTFSYRKNKYLTQYNNLLEYTKQICEQENENPEIELLGLL